MITDNLMKLSEKLVEYSKNKGADQVQVSAYSGSEFTVELRDGNIERLTEAGSKYISFKVILGNRVATASSSDLNDTTLYKLISNAVERAKLTSVDPFSDLPEKEELKVDVAKLKLYDPAVLELPAEKKIAMAKLIEKLSLADKKVKKSSGSYFSSNTGERFIANSNGFSGQYKYTSCSTGVELQAGSDDNMFEDGWHESSISLAGLASPDEIAKKAVHRVTRLIGAKKIDTQNVPIVLEPQMTGSLLGFLTQCVSGGAIYMNQSFLKDKIGSKIAADFVNIIDDGLIPGAIGSQPFDGEGVPSRKTPIIENGVLKNYLLSTYSARKLKMKSTGNASGPNNFYLSAGKYSPEEIIKSVNKGLLLVSTIGQGTVATTGDISKGAYGIWIENGELTYPVAEITISGNLGKMMQDVEMVGNDLEFKRSVTGPTIKIKEITISGK